MAPGPPRVAVIRPVEGREGALVRLVDAPPTPACVHLDEAAGRDCWAVDEDDWVEEGGHGPIGLRELADLVDERTWSLVTRGVQVVRFARDHRYCGRCATSLEAGEGSGRRCPHCGLSVFPRVDPAVIVLVEDDAGRALLARNARFPEGRYSCIAGFVEPGETLEDCVRREVAEEVGVELDRVRYEGSQPWPFPHSLMVAFTAHYAGGVPASDGVEIVDARWFEPSDLPSLPPPASIARRLIDAWLARQGGAPSEPRSWG